MIAQRCTSVADRLHGARRLATCVIACALAIAAGLALPAARTGAGATWTIVPSPNTAGHNYLVGVSCVSADACMAVGNAAGAPLVESWQGSVWSIAPTPSVPFGDFLQSVSCVNVNACTAVGGGLVESWNGAAWSIVPGPAAGALAGVSCVNLNACVAVGYYVSGYDSYQTLVESWNGSAWSVVTSPNVSTSDYFTGVSCVSVNVCTAVGTYYNGHYQQTLVESWDGTAWTIIPSPNYVSDSFVGVGETENVLEGVSCVSAGACIAVGYYVYVPYFLIPSSNDTLVESWDGAAWSIVPSPLFGTLVGVSCVSASACTAVGYVAYSEEYAEAEAWDGNAWSYLPAPEIYSYDGDALWDVSCASEGSCTAVGDYFGSARYMTLVETSAPVPAAPADLSIQKMHTGSFQQAEVGAAYTISIGNAAGAGFTSGTVTVTDKAPSSLTITGMSGDGWDCSVLPQCTRSDALPPGVTYPPIAVTVNVASNAPTGPNAVTNAATVVGGGDAGGPHSAADPTTINGSNQPPVAASLTIQKSHLGSFTQGQVGAMYTVTVGDMLGAGATSGTVTVADAAPPGITITGMSGAGWTCSALPLCSRSDSLSAGLSYSAIIVSANIAANAPASLTNYASVSGGGDPSGPHSAADPTTITGMAGPSEAASLSIALSHIGNFTQGQAAAIYTVTVGNAAGGGATSGSVTVADAAPPGITITGMSGSGWTCSALPICSRSDSLSAGVSYSAITVTASIAANAPASLTNYASVIGGGDPTGPHSAADPTTITGTAGPSLSISTSNESSFAQDQAGATYTLTVANATGAGPTAGAVTVSDSVPPGLVITAMSGAGWACTVPACTRSDALAGGQSYAAITVTVSVAANAATGANALTNHASVAGGGDPSAPHTVADPTTISGSSSPAAAALLSIQKTHSGSFSQGQTGATYSVIVSNAAGAGPTSGAVTVTDSAPPALTLTGMSGTGWTCSALPDCTRADALAAGQSYAAITVTVSVAANAATGVNALTNHASVSGGGDPSAPHTVADPTTISGTAGPSEAASLSIALGHIGNFTQSQTAAIYTVTVSNAAGGGATSGSVTVSDLAPPGLTITGMSGSGWTCAALPVCARSDSLAAGQSYPAIIVTTSVAANAPTGTNALTNHASVTGGGDLTAPHSAADPTTIQAGP